MDSLNNSNQLQLLHLAGSFYVGPVNPGVNEGPSHFYSGKFGYVFFSLLHIPLVY